VSAEFKRLWKIKKKMKRKLPEFLRPYYWRLKRLGTAWRKPKGIDNQVRLHKKGYPPLVKVGYRTPKLLRNYHPCGMKEALVHNPQELKNYDPKEYVIRIAATVGRRKRMEIMKEAQRMGFRVVNPLREEVAI